MTLHAMKNSTSCLSLFHCRAARKIGFALAATILFVTAVRADVVYVTSQIQGCTATSVCGGVNTDGTYTELNISLLTSGTKGSAPGRPITPTACRAYTSTPLFTDTNGGVDIMP